ncbi:MAG: phosphodiester glycosidase family protein [Clostridiaceae bacterium]|nr:phosphodiester glycosidase family protein [Clostridiaceae bacterium]
MKRLKKTLTALGLAAVLVTTTVSHTVAANGTIYEKVDKQTISSGVIHEHLLRFTKDGWINANAVYIDLENQNINVDILTSAGGLSTRETLSSMVRREEDVVAAINGDFFFLTNPGSPTGSMIKDGKMISSPVIGENLANFYINNENNAFASYWDYDIYITTDKGKKLTLGSINKYRWNYREIMLIDRNWGIHSPGATTEFHDMVEIVVIDNEVAEVRSRKPSVEIPEDGYVLLASAAKAYDLYNNLEVGDKVTVHTDISPNVENIKLGMGGGTVLVKDGKVAPFTQNVSGNHPRTAIGITRDRKQLILVTVDGRHTNFRGLDGRTLANLMIELGSYEAINMDGGGSTAMMARDLGEFDAKIINYPSDGTERRITNGLAVIANPSNQAMLGGIKAQFDYDRSFIGGSRRINVKAFDRNYNPLSVDYSKLEFSVKKGNGRFQGNNFIPASVGKHIIEVDYLGAKTEVAINVSAAPALLQVTPGQVGLSQGQKVTFNVMAVDKEGYRVPIDSKDILWKDKGGLGSFANGVYTAGNNSGSTILTATLDNKTTEIPVSIGSNSASLKGLDRYNTKYTQYPEGQVPGKITKDDNAKVGTQSLRLEYDFTKTDATRGAYMEFEKGSITMKDRVLSLGIWVHSFENASHWIRGHVLDATGKRHNIEFKQGIDWTGWKYLEASVPHNIPYPIELEKIYIVEVNANNKTTGKLLFDGLDIMYGMTTKEAVGGNRLKDHLNRPYTQKGTQFFVHSGIAFTKGQTLMDRIATNRMRDMINENYHKAIFTDRVASGILSEVKKPYMTAIPGHSVEEYEDNLIIHLDNRSKGLRATNANQWSMFLNAIESTNRKNIFVVLPKPLDGGEGFSDPLEKNLFKEKLTKTSQRGKNVFVLFGGEKEMTMNVVDGVRYISTGSYNATTSVRPQDNFKYIEFNISGEEVTYQIKSLFD